MTSHTWSARPMRPAALHRRCGVTLLELLVTLTLLAILAGVAGVSLTRTRATPDVDPEIARALAARDEAIRSGHPVTLTIMTDSASAAATAFPDGRVLADPRLGLDPLTGSVRDDDASTATR